MNPPYFTVSGNGEKTKNKKSGSQCVCRLWVSEGRLVWLSYDRKSDIGKL